MSRFIDKLNRLSRAESQPIGFRAAQPSLPGLRIQLVAGLAEESSDSLAECVTGADAGLLRISRPDSGSKTLQKMSQAYPDIPWGGWLQDGGLREAAPAGKAGGDFFVFPATGTPLITPQDDEAGKVIAVEASLSEGLLRAVNELSVDAVLIAGEPGEDYFLTWQHLMLFRRFADLLEKPLLVPVPSEVTAAELQAVWEAGVSGVVVELSDRLPKDRMSELRSVIDNLTFPSRSKREKTEPLLPRTGSGLGADIEEE